MPFGPPVDETAQASTQDPGAFENLLGMSRGQFIQSALAAQLGIDQLAPMKARLLDTQIKEQQMRNARFATDAQHQDALFALTQGEMQAKNEASTLENVITKATMANRIKASEEGVNKLKADSQEASSRGKYYNTLAQEQQLKTAQALGQASAGTQIGLEDINALTDGFISSAGIDESQKPIAKMLYGNAIAGGLAQKQQQLNEVKQTNDMMAQQKRMDDISKLVQFGANSSDPGATIEGAGRFLGMDTDTINFAKQAASTMKQPMVTPKEDSYTKAKGEDLSAAEGMLRKIVSDNSSDGTPAGLNEKYKKRYDKQNQIVNDIREELDNYQKGATGRQIPKKAVVQGKPGATTEGGVSTTRNASLGKSSVDTFLDGNPYVLKFNDQQLEAVAKQGGLDLNELKAAIVRRKQS